MLQTEDCGPLVVDLRELICLPVFVHGCYRHQLPEDHVLGQLLHPGMTVFDVGANIGYYTAYISRRVSPGGTVVAVEPMPRALRLLEMNAALCQPPAIVEAAAVGPEPGTCHIREMKKLDISFVQFDESADGVTVPVITIDQLSEKYGHPDLLKIDVEGAEMLALGGASKTLSTTPLPIVMIEYVSVNAAQFGAYSLEELLQKFDASRFRFFRIAKPGRLVAKGYDSPEATNDYLAVPVNRMAEIAPLLAGAQ